MAGLLDLDVKAMVREEYELGDITDYKRAANKLQKIEGIDLVIALVPDVMEEDDRTIRLKLFGQRLISRHR